MAEVSMRSGDRVALDTATQSRRKHRAARYAALADVSRLTMVDALALTDLSPVELGRLLDAPSNLVAHHLSVLRQVGLVSQVRSEGDARRAYVRLVPGAMDDLVVWPRWHADRVVFVCRGNSARSQLAEALWRQQSTVPVSSAGTHPAPHVHPGAIAAARRHRVPMSRPRTRHLTDVVRPTDVLIALCDEAHEELSAAGASRGNLHWSVADPVRVETDEAFDLALTQIADRVRLTVSAHESPQEVRR